MRAEMNQLAERLHIWPGDTEGPGLQRILSKLGGSGGDYPVTFQNEDGHVEHTYCGLSKHHRPPP